MLNISLLIFYYCESEISILYEEFPLKILLLFSMLSMMPLQKAEAQKEPLRIRNYTERDGLSENIVTGILRDSKGFVWITTAFGINRFDGERFFLFSYPYPGMDYLLQNNFTGVVEYKPGNLLFTTYSGVVYHFSYSTGRLILLDDLADDLKGTFIRNICVTGKNEIAFCTPDGFILTDLSFTKKYELKLSEKGGFNPEFTSVNLVVKDKKGNYWVGCYHMGLLHYEAGSGKITRGTSGVNPVDMQINDISFSHDSSALWVAASGIGLLKTDISSGRSELIDSDSRGVKFPFTKFSDITVSGDSLIFAGSRNGLLILNLKTGDFKTLSGAKNGGYVTAENVINYVFADEGSLFWIGTNGGISILDYNKPVFTRMTSGIEGSDAEVTGFYFSDGNEVYISTSRGLIRKGTENTADRYFDLKRLSGNPDIETVFNPVEDGGGNIWMGTWGGGILRLKKGDFPDNLSSGLIENFTVQGNVTMTNNFVRKIIRDKVGNLWFATWGGGLLMLEKSRLNDPVPLFSVYKKPAKPQSGSVISNFIADILCDQSGRIWLTSSSGMQYYDFESKKFADIKIWNDGEGSYLNYPGFLHEAGNGDIWGGTYTGLIRIKAGMSGGFITEKYFFDRLPFGTLQPLSDKSGNIWFGGRGSRLYKFNPATKELTGIDLYSEGRGFNFSLGSSASDKYGNLYFAGVSGAIKINPGEIKKSADQPLLKISGILINNKPALLSSDPSETGEISLNYKQNNITVNFGYLDYHEEKVIMYRYMLEGADNDWISITEPSVTFSNLSPGTYVLRINSTGRNGLWLSEEIRLKISIAAPFWQTVYFRIMTGILIIFAVSYYLYRRAKISEEEAKRQTEFSGALIRLQEGERRRVSGELHDSIGQNLLVLKNIFDMRSKGHTNIAGDEEISSILKDSISELRSISTDLYPHQIEQLGLIKAVESMIRKVGRSSEIIFSFSSPSDESVIPEEYKIHLYRIIQEAVSNAVKHSGGQNCVISLEFENDELKITISDDGIGLQGTKPGTDINSDDSSGMGLKNIAERVKMMNGDLVINGKTDNGTELIITLRMDYEKKNTDS